MTTAMRIQSKPSVVILAAIGLTVLVVAWLAWRSRPPQMGADDAVFSNVDALFTAVTARDEKRLAECEARLRALKNAGTLPADAADYLDGVFAAAHAGRWQAAAERLYDFMKVQRRDGAGEQTVKRKDKSRPAVRSQ
jgi:hypothetical protein